MGNPRRSRFQLKEGARCLLVPRYSPQPRLLAPGQAATEGGIAGAAAAEVACFLDPTEVAYSPLLMLAMFEANPMRLFKRSVSIHPHEPNEKDPLHPSRPLSRAE